MKSISLLILAAVAFGTPLTTTEIFAADPMSTATMPSPVDQTTAASKDSGTLMRAHPEMKTVIQKPMRLGAKPVSTLKVSAA